MIRCTGCARHVREADVDCPFCARPRAGTAHKALQFMGGVTTTVVLAACYGGFDDKGWSTGYNPTPGTPTGAGTLTGGTTTPCGGFGTTLAVTTTWTDDGAPPSDSDADGINDTNCDADTLEICIGDPLGVAAWDFGMAESGAAGWTGEDCMAGDGGFNLCHPILSHGATLTEVCTPAEVTSGSTTLFDAGKDPYLTYFLADATSCYVWGLDPAYYASLGCSELM